MKRLYWNPDVPPGAGGSWATAGQYLSICSLLFLLVLSVAAAGQSGNESGQIKPPSSVKEQPDELTQELDLNSAILSKMPADPLVQPDPLAPIFRPVDRLSEKLTQSTRLKFGATYTFLNQYATIVPEVNQDTTSSADVSISPEHGERTTMEALRDLSACSSVPAQTSASASNSTLAIDSVQGCI